MEKYKIKSLSLTNWKGKTISVDFGEVNVISGFNQSGKTLLMKAHNWLLSSYTDAVTPKNHELFDNREEITENTPMAEVEALVQIGEYEYKLKKTARAKFTRNKEDGEMKKASSDEYKFYIDDVERSASDFNMFVSDNICSLDYITFCLNGSFFTTLAENDKDKARKALSDIIGEVKDEDLKGDYTKLFELKNRNGIDIIKSNLKSQKGKCNERLSILPNFIDSKQEELGTLNEINFDEIEKEIEIAKDTINAIDNQIKDEAESIKPILEKRKELSVLASNKEIELERKKKEYENYEPNSVKELRSRLKHINDLNVEINRKNKESEDKIETLRKEKERTEQLVSILSDKRQSLLDKNKKVKERIFEEQKCAYCGQELPIDQIEKLRDNFNIEKEKEQKNIISEGKEIASELSEKKEYLEKLTSQIETGFIPEKLQDSSIIETKIKEELSKIPLFEETDECKVLLSEIVEIKKTIPDIPESDSKKLEEDKKRLMDEKEALDRRYGMKVRLDDLKREIEKLKNEQLLNSQEVANILSMENLIKEYEREKAEVTSNRVNKLLEITNIVMQRQQKNGEWADDCIVTDTNGVKFSTINDASRILIQADIQRMFCKYYGVNFPIWIDNCSLVDENNRPKYSDVQMFYIENKEEKFNVKIL